MGQGEPRHFKTASTLKDLPPERYPEIALAGRSNVGKSSLINVLMGRKLAPISRTPGKTRSLRFYAAPIRGHGWLTLVDLPGYGWARLPLKMRQQWRSLVEGYLTQRSTLRAVALVADIRRGSTELDGEMADWLRREPLPYVVVATKVDKIRATHRHRLLTELADGAMVELASVIPFSAKTGEGKRELFAAFAAMALGPPGP